MRQKTIFITCADGYEIRNWILGKFYHAAKDHKEIRVVAFVTPDRLASCAPLTHERWIVEPIVLDPHWENIKRFFRIACFGCVPTTTIWARNWFSYFHGGSLPSLVAKQFFWGLGHFRLWRAVMRIIEYYFFRDDSIWKPYFDKYSPDVVFGAGILNDESITLIKYAKRQGIKSAGIMKSWDNFTSKGFLRIFPDVLLVQTPTMAEEAVRFNNFPKGRIQVTGFPQWDYYLDPSWYMNKKEFAEKFGLDFTKRWIVYFGGGLMTGLFSIPDRGDHVLMLMRAIERGEIEDAQIIIRMHPGHKDLLRDEVRVNPILTFGKGWNFSLEDLKTLANLVRLSDVTINLGSTMALEAAIFDKPIVLLSFNGYAPEEEIPWHHRQSVALAKTLHYQYVQDTGGVWRVSSEKEFVEAVKTYLNNSSLHKTGRAHIVRQLVGPIDGRGGERAFMTILGLCNRT